MAAALPRRMGFVLARVASRSAPTRYRPRDPACPGSRRPPRAEAARGFRPAGRGRWSGWVREYWAENGVHSLLKTGPDQSGLLCRGQATGVLLSATPSAGSMQMLLCWAILPLVRVKFRELMPGSGGSDMWSCRPPLSWVGRHGCWYGARREIYVSYIFLTSGTIRGRSAADRPPGPGGCGSGE